MGDFLGSPRVAPLFPPNFEFFFVFGYFEVGHGVQSVHLEKISCLEKTIAQLGRPGAKLRSFEGNGGWEGVIYK